MCAKNEPWQKTSPNHTNAYASSSSPQTHSRQRSRGSLQEELRFAGWFWRSTSDESKSRSRPLWIYILVLNAVIAFILQFLIGLIPALGVFLLIQCITTFLLFPRIPRKVNRILRKPTLQTSEILQVYPLADVKFFLNSTSDIVLMSHKGGNSATAMLVIDKVPVGIRGNMLAFIRAIYSAGVPLYYALVHAPISHQSLPYHGAISEKAQNTLTNLDSSQQAAFAWRKGGLWKTRLILGTRRDISTLNGDYTTDVLTNQVQHDLQTLQIAFRTAYPHIRLRRLTGTELEDGIRSLLLQGKPPHFF
jgi:hypothetical protein